MLPFWARMDLGAMAMIPQSPCIAGTSPSDCLVSYAGHSLGGGSYPSAEVLSVYSIAPTDRAIHRVNVKTVLFQIIQFSISTLFSSILNNTV